MASRIPRHALRPCGLEEKFPRGFSSYLTEWQLHTKNSINGFLSDSTAEGLLVTSNSTIQLANYLCEKCQFKYILTSHISQDKLENVFGIVRQANEVNNYTTPANNHTTPAVFNNYKRAVFL